MTYPTLVDENLDDFQLTLPPRAPIVEDDWEFVIPPRVVTEDTWDFKLPPLAAPIEPEWDLHLPPITLPQMPSDADLATLDDLLPKRSPDVTFDLQLPLAKLTQRSNLETMFRELEKDRANETLDEEIRKIQNTPLTVNDIPHNLPTSPMTVRYFNEPGGNYRRSLPWSTKMSIYIEKPQLAIFDTAYVVGKKITRAAKAIRRFFSNTGQELQSIVDDHTSTALALGRAAVAAPVVLGGAVTEPAQNYGINKEPYSQGTIETIHDIDDFQATLTRSFNNTEFPQGRQELLPASSALEAALALYQSRGSGLSVKDICELTNTSSKKLYAAIDETGIQRRGYANNNQTPRNIQNLDDALDTYEHSNHTIKEIQERFGISKYLLYKGLQERNVNLRKAQHL